MVAVNAAFVEFLGAVFYLGFHKGIRYRNRQREGDGGGRGGGG